MVGQFTVVLWQGLHGGRGKVRALAKSLQPTLLPHLHHLLHHAPPLVHDLVYCGLLVPGPGHDVLVVIADVAGEHGGGLLRHEDGGAVGRPPGVEEVVLARGDEPLAAVSELEGEDAALVEVELVLVGLVAVEHLHVRVLHADCEPVAGWAVAQAEYLGAEVVLLQLPALPQVPRPHRVVQPSRPQLRAICRDVDTRGPVGVALELAHQRLVVQVPHRDVAVAAAAEADLAVWRDGQGVARRSRGSHFSLNSWSWRREVPDRNGASLAAHHQGVPIGQQLDAADVVIPGEAVQLGDWGLATGLADVPHLDTSLAS